MKSSAFQEYTLFQQAVAVFQKGHLAEAEMLVENVLDINPAYADASHLLGIIAGQRGQYDLAERFIACAIKNNPDQPVYRHTYALALQQGGRLEEAVEACWQAIEFNPNFAETYNILGYAFKGMGYLKKAEDACNKAVMLNPRLYKAHNNLGSVLQAQGMLDKALASYTKAVSLKPDYVEALNNLGLVYQYQGRLEEALGCFQKALSIKSDYAEVYNNLGNVYQKLGRLVQALECYQKAISIQPDCADAHANRGAVLWAMGRCGEAERSLRHALELKPGVSGTHYNLGNVLREKGDREQAIGHYKQAVSLNPDYDEARWAYVMTHIPLFYGTEDDVALIRDDFSREIKALNTWFDPARIETGYKAVGSLTPFYLAYQEENNRELLSCYGELCASLMGYWLEEQGIVPNRTGSGERVRVGVISAHIHEHSVWNALVKGWFGQLDRGRLELHAFHTGSKQDEETAWARKQSVSFTQGERDLRQWVELILDKCLDVLIYPEIGMDVMTVKLASMRLGKVQMVAWGHPETSGLPTIDYYLSAEDFEPPAAQDNYTEKLVSLPHLGCCYHPFMVNDTSPDLAGLGIDSGSPILICPGVPFKYVSRHDDVFIAIARLLGRCQFIFFKDNSSDLSIKLQRRMEQAFARAGLDFQNYGNFIAWQKKSAFQGIMKRADVFLDTLGFSGFNTAMQAVECGLPIVTLDGRYMRGRLAAGIMRRMGLYEMVAGNLEDYINLVVRLAKDRGYNENIRQRIEASRSVLFDDMEPIQAMEDFLCYVAKDVTVESDL